MSISNDFRLSLPFPGLLIVVGLIIGVLTPISVYILDLSPLVVILGVIVIFISTSLLLLAPPLGILSFLVITRSIIEGAQLLQDILPNFVISKGTAALGGLAVIWSLFYIFTRKVKFFQAPLIGFFSILLVGSFFPVIVANSIEGVIEWIRLLSICLVYVVSYSITSRSTFRIPVIPIVLLLSTILPLLVGYYMYINGIVFRSLGLERMISTFSSPNRYAVYLAQGLTVCIGLFFWSHSRKGRLAVAFYALALAGGIVLTLARISWLMVLIALLILGLLLDKRLWLLVMAASVASLQLPQVRERFLSEYISLTGSQSNIAGRLSAWVAALRLFVQKPVFGHGLAYFRGGEIILDRNFTIPHNVYIQVLVEGGIVSFVSFILLWVSILFETMKKVFLKGSVWNKILLALLVQVLLAMSSENLYGDTANMWFFMAFLGFALADRVRYHHSRTSEHVKVVNTV